jgi:hypothetical protein
LPQTLDFLGRLVEVRPPNVGFFTSQRGNRRSVSRGHVTILLDRSVLPNGQSRVPEQIKDTQHRC